MKVHQGRVACKVVIGGVNTKVRIGDGGTRHDNAVKNLLEIRGRTLVGMDVENGEVIGWGRKAKRTAILTKRNQRIT